MDDSVAPASEPAKEDGQMQTSAASPRQSETSHRLPPRPGMRPGLEDKRHILDSPVLLPFMTVRSGTASVPVQQVVCGAGLAFENVAISAGGALPDDRHLASSLYGSSRP